MNHLLLSNKQINTLKKAPEKTGAFFNEHIYIKKFIPVSILRLSSLRGTKQSMQYSICIQDCFVPRNDGFIL